MGYYSIEIAMTPEYGGDELRIEAPICLCKTLRDQIASRIIDGVIRQALFTGAWLEAVEP